MISEVIREDEHSNSSNNGDDSSKSNHSDDDFDRKSDNAIDYSDINELAEDLQVLMQEVNKFRLTFFDCEHRILFFSLPETRHLQTTPIMMTSKIPFL